MNADLLLDSADISPRAPSNNSSDSNSCVDFVSCYDGSGTEVIKLHGNAGPRRHTKPHSCDMCSASFGSKMELEEHQNSHTGQKPFECDVCRARFNRRSTLWNHKRIHSDTKPFTCPVCGITFKWKNSLKCHKEMHLRKNETGPMDPTVLQADVTAPSTRGRNAVKSPRKRKTNAHAESEGPLDGITQGVKTEDNFCSSLPGGVVQHTSILEAALLKSSNLRPTSQHSPLQQLPTYSPEVHVVQKIGRPPELNLNFMNNNHIPLGSTSQLNATKLLASDRSSMEHPVSNTSGSESQFVHSAALSGLFSVQKKESDQLSNSSHHPHIVSYSPHINSINSNHHNNNSSHIIAPNNNHLYFTPAARDQKKPTTMSDHGIMESHQSQAVVKSEFNNLDYVPNVDFIHGGHSSAAASSNSRIVGTSLALPTTNGAIRSAYAHSSVLIGGGGGGGVGGNGAIVCSNSFPVSDAANNSFHFSQTSLGFPVSSTARMFQHHPVSYQHHAVPLPIHRDVNAHQNVTSANYASLLEDGYVVKELPYTEW